MAETSAGDQQTSEAADWRAAVPIIVGVAGMFVLYAIGHDLVTAHLCPMYFNEAHPDLGVPAVFHAQSPNVLGAAWGIAAGTGPGIAVGSVYAAAAQLGRRERVGLGRVWRVMLAQLLLMGGAAAIVGWVTWARAAGSVTRDLDTVYAIHLATYASGAVGTLLAAAAIIHQRGRPAMAA